MKPVAAPAVVSLPRTPERIRQEFPLLERRIEDKQVAYLDNAATSQKPASVLEAMDSFYRRSNANIHRSMHQLAAEATAFYEGGRERVAGLIGARPEETIFVRNATEAINLVRFSWGRRHVAEGDTVLITRMEHHSNVVPWQLLCEEQGARLEYVELTEDGGLDLTSLERQLGSGRVKLVAVTHVSNVLGTINPVAEISARAADAGAVTLLDGAQAVPQLPVDVTATGADFYAFTGHKMFGPTGIGVLWGRRELLDEMPPFLAGGSMIGHVADDHSTWAPLPAKFEAGTPAIAEAAGLGAAADYLADLGMDAVRSHERELTAYALERLAGVSGLTIYGPLDPAERGSLVSFTIEGIHPHDLAEFCNREAICIRAGHHCAQPLMRVLGVPGTARASFSVYNTAEEVDRLVDALESAKAVFAV
jgi:cysteine desulfurase / selenocysteine lyase